MEYFGVLGAIIVGTHVPGLIAMWLVWHGLQYHFGSRFLLLGAVGVLLATLLGCVVVGYFDFITLQDLYPDLYRDANFWATVLTRAMLWYGIFSVPLLVFLVLIATPVAALAVRFSKTRRAT
ncbi:hypothetical protein [Devosia sp. SL43]|uniref:hypothetical protein n=1 Tax=Devosia sp. SL43 TaxID=2806348 RepID=UPI001F25F71D|nr:hypothetical protein [Devosia sp. SL43]UJW84165.1 hypothetical protein IM737_12025 [Devosia sp. SL43]